MISAHRLRRLSEYHSTLFLLVLILAVFLSDAVRSETKLRGELEKELAAIADAYESVPENYGLRSTYADLLFKLGDIWQANDVITPLATATSTNAEYLRLGAETSLLLADYDRAEILYRRLFDISKEDSEIYAEAVKGLAMVYYQTNRYELAAQLKLPESIDTNSGLGSLLIYMQRFDGKPYQIEWHTTERVAHVPIINDFTQPGDLPLVKLEVNGCPVKFILDTGGDRLYIDESIAAKAGVRDIASRRAKYAYTKGEYVEEPLGVADSVTLGDVSLHNVPVIVAKWKVMGQPSDGVITTQILKQFLSTIDYENKEIVFRERSEAGLRQFLDTFKNKEPYRLPFFIAGSHMMFTKGTLNGHDSLNILVDCGLAATMPLVILEETVKYLGLEKHTIEGTNFYWSPIKSYGIGRLISGEAQALGNVFVEENPYWQHGFVFDALISHEYLRHLGSWTIDFDNMLFYFPGNVSE
jgi:tetratricopeptide (TPR) repeat protein